MSKSITEIENEENLIPKLKDFLNHNLNKFTKTVLDIINIHDLSESLEDPGNEIMIGFLLQAEDLHDYESIASTPYPVESIIDIGGLNKLLGENMALFNGYLVTAEKPIQLNYSIMLFVTLLA